METLGYIKVRKMHATRSAEHIPAASRKAYDSRIPVKRARRNIITDTGSGFKTDSSGLIAHDSPLAGIPGSQEGAGSAKNAGARAPKRPHGRARGRHHTRDVRYRHGLKSDGTLYLESGIYSSFNASGSLRSTSWASRSGSTASSFSSRSRSSLIVDVTAAKDIVEAISTTYDGLDSLDASKFISWDSLDFITDGEVVGTGSQGIIYTATWNDKRVAVKMGTDISIIQEHIILGQFCHPCIVKTFGWTTTKSSELEKIGVHFSDCCVGDEAPVFSAVYEYCGRRDLKSLLRTKPRLRADLRFMTNVLIDILDGLKLIHERGYLHCDIKPDNILIDENYRAKVADFGLCQKMEPGMSVQGTPSYIAPEMVADWFGYVDDCLWDAKADVFSFGVLVTVSLTGSFPFQRITEKLKARRGFRDHKQLQRHFTPSTQMMSQIAQVSHSLLSIINRCLKLSAEKRASTEELRADLDELRQLHILLEKK